MIIVPSKRIIECEASLNTRKQGWFKIEALKVDADGIPIEKSRRVVADWFPNLITDQGLNRIGANSDWLTACQVGSGTADPLVTDTGLQTFVAGTSTTQATALAAQGSPPYYIARTKTYRFAAGAAAGNLSEVGVGWATTGSTLFSRARILDGMGAPTTITVLSDEVLDVTYQIRVYPPTTDVIDTVSISGSDYDIILRAAQVTTASAWNIGTSGSNAGAITGEPSVAYSGDIGAITGLPSGTIGTANAFSTSAAYSNNSLERAATVNFGLNDGNVGGIRAVLFKFVFSRLQIQFDPVIPKDNTKTLSLTFKHSWARKTL